MRPNQEGQGEGDGQEVDIVVRDPTPIVSNFISTWSKLDSSINPTKTFDDASLDTILFWISLIQLNLTCPKRSRPSHSHHGARGVAASHILICATGFVERT